MYLKEAGLGTDKYLYDPIQGHFHSDLQLILNRTAMRT